MTPEQSSWKQRLEAIGVSQAAFADMLGLRYADVSIYLNCKREPKATRFQQIEAVLKNLEAQ